MHEHKFLPQPGSRLIEKECGNGPEIGLKI